MRRKDLEFQKISTEKNFRMRRKVFFFKTIQNIFSSYFNQFKTKNNKYSIIFTFPLGYFLFLSKISMISK